MIGDITPEQVLAELNKPENDFNRDLAGGMMMRLLKDSPLRFGHMEKVYNLPNEQFKQVNKQYVDALRVGRTSI